MQRSVLLVLLVAIFGIATASMDLPAASSNSPASPVPSLIETSASKVSQDASLQALMTQQIGAGAEATAKSLAMMEAEATVSTLRRREDRFVKIMGPELKSRFDNVRYVFQNAPFLHIRRWTPLPHLPSPFVAHMYFDCLLFSSLDHATFFSSRAGRWLFNEGRLEEGAAMYSRAMEMYSKALIEPLKEFTSYATLGKAIIAKEHRRALEKREEEAAAQGDPALKDNTESIFLEFAKAVKFAG